jgi:hypothetical protein
MILNDKMRIQVGFTRHIRAGVDGESFFFYCHGSVSILLHLAFSADSLVYRR